MVEGGYRPPRTTEAARYRPSNNVGSLSAEQPAAQHIAATVYHRVSDETSSSKYTYLGGQLEHPEVLNQDEAICELEQRISDNGHG